VIAPFHVAFCWGVVGEEDEGGGGLRWRTKKKEVVGCGGG